MDTIISVLSFIKSLIPDKTILVFYSNETFRRGEFEWILENKSNNSVKINNVQINGIEINEIGGILEHKIFPINLNPMGKLKWKFFMSKDNHFLNPQNVIIKTSSFFGGKKIEINL